MRQKETYNINKARNKARRGFGGVLIVMLAVLAGALAGGCIKNDIPYPHIQANILTINAEGQDQGTVIDTINRVVTFNFPEETDIYNIRITDYTLTPGAHLVGEPFAQPVDLSKPLPVTVELYQQYEWTNRGVQNIERYFTVQGQIGQTVIDVPGKRVIASVTDNENLAAIKVTSMKLGPKGAVTSPDLDGKTVDFTKPVTVQVSYWGRTETWTIYIEVEESTVSTLSVDAWTCVAWVNCAAIEGRDNGVEYRFATGGDNDWVKVPKGDISFNGGSFTARISHLSPNTKYQARAYSDAEYGAVLDFTTGSVIQPPNMSLDQWWLSGKVWNPWPENGEQYWDTGNKGATTLGSSNSFPTDNTSSGSGWAAQLETRFVGIGSIGKLAAGNLFIGKYVKTDGTNGILSFGREFTQRPTKLRGYFKYTTAPISSTTSGFESLAGRPDTCIIWCSLIDQNEPFEIRTNPKNRQLFDENGSYVVAYGKLECGENVNTWTPFEFTLNYRSTSRVPKYLLITASASKYGDYFTGGNGAVLYLDDLELLYDY